MTSTVSESFFKKNLPSKIFSELRVVNLSGLEVTAVWRDETTREENKFLNASLIQLNTNSIQHSGLDSIWWEFISCWWLYLSNNRIASISNIQFPFCFGSLDLSANPFQLLDYSSLYSIHILRFSVSPDSILGEGKSVDPYWDKQLTVTKKLPNVWVYNENFIPSTDRLYFLQNNSSIQDDHFHNSNWSSIKIQPRQSSLLSILHELNRIDDVTDEMKLTILLEDYLNEVYLWNDYCNNIQLSNNCAIKVAKKKPQIQNIDIILFLPHRKRLDLSILLTCSILFTIPIPLLIESVIILAGEFISKSDIEALVKQPLFVKTAMIALIRRITKLEYSDYEKGLLPRLALLNLNPSQDKVYHASFIPTFAGINGFQFLRTVYQYLHYRFDSTDSNHHHHHHLKTIPRIESFSELELEILNNIPNIITKWSGFKCPLSKETKDISFHNWVSFVTRHAVFILNKAPSCPPLNTVCRSVKEQAYYCDLLPMLQAANMSLLDLDIITIGPELDGRMIPSNLLLLSSSSSSAATSASDYEEDLSTLTDYQRRLHIANRILQGKILPFGVGLPKGHINQLRWKANEETIRYYEKPWQSKSPHQTAAAAATADKKVDIAKEENKIVETEFSANNTFFVTSQQDTNDHYQQTDMNVTTGMSGKIRKPPQHGPRVIPQIGRPIVYKLDENNTSYEEDNYYDYHTHHQGNLKEYRLEYQYQPFNNKRLNSPTNYEKYLMLNHNYQHQHQQQLQQLPTPHHNPNVINNNQQQQFVNQNQSYHTMKRSESEDCIVAPEFFPPELRPFSRSRSNDPNYIANEINGLLTQLPGTPLTVSRRPISQGNYHPQQGYLPEIEEKSVNSFHLDETAAAGGEGGAGGGGNDQGLYQDDADVSLYT
jgi:hypothetical protein